MTINVPPRLDGDPDRIREYALRFSETAAALQRATSELRALADDGIAVSIVIDVVRERARTTAGEAEHTATRYDDAADAYRTYAYRLEEAQAKADRARGMIDTIDGPANRWEFEQRSLEQQEMFTLGPPSEELVEANLRVAAFEREYANAMSLYHEAQEDVRTAARAAEHALHGAAAAAKLNDSLIQRISATTQQGYELLQRYLGNAISAVRAGLELARAALDVAAIALGALGVLLPPLLPASWTLAFALKLASAAFSVSIAGASIALFSLGREGGGTAMKDSIRAARDVVEHLGRVKRGGLAGIGLAVFESASKDVLPTPPKEIAEDMAFDVLDVTLEYELDVRFDAFANLSGPAWGDNAIALSPQLTRDYDGIVSGEAARELQEDIALDSLKALPLGGIFSALNELHEEMEEFQLVVSGSGS